MDRVARFEERRIRKWQGLFVAMVALLSLSTVLFGWLAYQEAALRQLDALFVLLGEDWEIILEYWQDTLSTIWIEYPKEFIFPIVFLVVCSIVFVYSTRHSRRIITKKKEELRTLKRM